MSAWIVAMRALFVAAVVGLAWATGLSTVISLVIASSALVLVALASIWLPPARRIRATGRGPGDPSGDRFPRRPLPFVPTIAAEEPIPHA